MRCNGDRPLSHRINVYKSNSERFGVRNYIFVCILENRPCRTPNEHLMGTWIVINKGVFSFHTIFLFSTGRCLSCFRYCALHTRGAHSRTHQLHGVPPVCQTNKKHACLCTVFRAMKIQVAESVCRIQSLAVLILKSLDGWNKRIRAKQASAQKRNVFFVDRTVKLRCTHAPRSLPSATHELCQWNCLRLKCPMDARIGRTQHDRLSFAGPHIARCHFGGIQCILCALAHCYS